MLKTIDMTLIRSFNPCYDPAKHLPEDFKGTALEILRHPTIPDSDKLWVVLRTEIIEEKTLRLFAVECAARAVSNLGEQSSEIARVIANTLAVSKRYALGQATEEERSAARSAADSAARSAARSAADSAADSAAYSAADSAAYSAADSAARSAQVRWLVDCLAIQDHCLKNTNAAAGLKGIKHDDGKPDMSLLSPIALDEVAKVMTFGKKKYAAHNWRGGFVWSRPLAAALRHTFAFLSGEDKDPETGLSHLAHAICCLMFVLEFTRTGAGEDDRYKGAPLNGNDKK